MSRQMNERIQHASSPLADCIPTSSRLVDPDFEYRNHTQTDVQATWRRFGWRPTDPRQQAAVRAKLNRM